jgi:hypothetical protein
MELQEQIRTTRVVVLQVQWADSQEQEKAQDWLAEF